MEVENRRSGFKGENTEGRIGVKCKNRMGKNISGMGMFEEWGGEKGTRINERILK